MAVITGSVLIEGTSSSDEIYGSDAEDVIYGYMGNDTIEAGGGNDDVKAGAGRDVVHGGEGNDTIYGDADNDTIYGDAGNDELHGGVGSDLLYGGEGDDTLYGDETTASGMRDTMIGGPGNDIYYVDHSDDKVIEEAGEGEDTIYSKGVNVTLDGNVEWLENNYDRRAAKLTGSIAAETIWGSQEARYDGDTIDGKGGNDSIKGSIQNDVIYFYSGDTVDAGDGNDRIIVMNTPDAGEIHGGNGDDTLEIHSMAGVTITIDGIEHIKVTGGGGAILDGGTSTDNMAMVGTEHDDTLSGGEGDDTIRGLGGNDSLSGNGGDDTIEGGLGNDTLRGGDGNDSLAGGEGDDVLDGGSGADIMAGGTGNDIYYVDDDDDRIIEGINSGTDSIYTDGVAINLDAFQFLNVEYVENTGNGTSLLGSLANETLVGGAGDDTISGGGGNDSIVGGEGSNELSGGTGNDTLLAGNEGDVMDGGTGNDSLVGGDGDDTIDGGAGADTLIGGKGDDKYYIDNRGDIVEEKQGEGQDTIYVDGAISADLNDFANIEHLENVSSSFNVMLYGRAGTVDTIKGSENFTSTTRGGDTIDGRGGDIANGQGDMLEGSVARDHIMFYNYDTVYAGSGDDTIEISGSVDHGTIDGGDGEDVLILSGRVELGSQLSISNVEILRGSDKDDSIDASQLGDFVIDGGLGNDTIIGGNGNDTLLGNNGNDILYGNAGEDILNGGAGNDSLVGGDGNDTLIGDTGNDTLDGIDGNNRLDGGGGNDLYRVHSAGDVVIEATTGGTDTIETFGVDINLNSSRHANVEYVENMEGVGISLVGSAANETLIGNSDSDYISGGAGNDYLDGKDGDNTIEGGAGNDILVGGNGDDTLDGGTGNDTMRGGAGDDAYYVDTANDRVLEQAGEGEDSVFTDGISVDLNQFGEIEYLENTSGTRGVSLRGSADRSETIQGSSILGGGKGDTIDGRGGNDIIVGSAGNDTVYFYDGDNIDEENAGGRNYIYLMGAVNNGTLAGSGHDTLAYANTSASLGGGAVVSGIDYLLGSTGSDNMDVSGLGGNGFTIDGGAGNDTITAENGFSDVTILGGAGNDVLIGGAGKNNLQGGIGNDSVVGGGDNDTLMGGDGTDTLEGGSGNDVLDGGAGNDILDGGDGLDTMIGGAGNDIYYVDDDGDVVQELASGGRDSIFVNGQVNVIDLGSTQFANVEYVRQDGTSDITLLGGNGMETLIGNAGNDSIHGGAGSDSIVGGGADNDTQAGNTLVGGAGNDTIIGGDGHDIIVGDDTLNPALRGSDSMVGGAGNDVYYVNATGDRVVERDGEGEDSIYTDAVNIDLGTNQFAYVEYVKNISNAKGVTLRGAAGRSETLEGSDSLPEGSKGDTIDGRGGDGTTGTGDLIIGSTGNDVIYFYNNDVVNAWAGNNRILITKDASNGTIRGGSGSDTVEVAGGSVTLGTGLVLEDINFLKGSTTGDTIDASGLTSIDFALDGGAGNDELKGSTTIGSTLIGGSGNDTLWGGNASDTLHGDAGNDELHGGDGDDFLYGGAGNDLLYGEGGENNLEGGAGNDKYFLENSNDKVVEERNGGKDSIYVNGFNVDLSVGGAYENIEYVENTAAGAVEFLGTIAAETLVGGVGNDTLDGRGGADQLRGGDGDDIYYVHSTRDKIVEEANQGNDTIKTDGINISLVSFANVEAVENVSTLKGAVLNGSAVTGSQTLKGSVNLSDITQAGDTIDGKGGNDTLAGGSARDVIYFYDGDQFADADGAGTGDDTIRLMTDMATATTIYGGEGTDVVEMYKATSIANLVLDGVEKLVGTTRNDTIDAAPFTGNHVTVDGGAGNDSITGGTGADILLGGAGNDTLVGKDDNDSLDGGAGNDFLDGGDGADELVGGVGNDFLDGGAGVDMLNGGAGNDMLFGGAGGDVMDGGAGNDVYHVDSDSDVVTEAPGSGGGRDSIYTDYINIDLNGAFQNVEYVEVRSSKETYTEMYKAMYRVEPDSAVVDAINNNQEAGVSLIGSAGNETLIGGVLGDTIEGGAGADSLVGRDGNNSLVGGAGNDTLVGGKDNDSLEGGDGNDSLVGGEGNNTLNGGAGADTMRGGSGNDLYYIDHANDRIYEKDAYGADLGGRDTIYTDGINIDLRNFGNIENVYVKYENNADDASNRVSLVGLARHQETLSGVADGVTVQANLYIDGKGGDTTAPGKGDYIVGGDGNDTIIFHACDTIYAGQGDNLIKTTGEDFLHIFNSNAEIRAGWGMDTLEFTTAAGRPNGQIYRVSPAMQGIDYFKGSTSADYIHFSTFGGEITLDGGTGSGADTLVAGTVDKLLILGNAGRDVLVSGGGGGTISLSGGADGDYLVGMDAGETGSDTLDGGAGADVYYISNKNTVIVDGGSALDRDTLYINGVLYGGGDINVDLKDTQYGGNGTTGVLEYVSCSSPTQSAITSLEATLVPNFVMANKIIISGGSTAETLIATGSGMASLDGGAGNDSLVGSSGNDTLRGGVGYDTMDGGAGDDVYYVDHLNDTIREQSDRAAGGVDTIYTDGIDINLGGNKHKGVEYVQNESTIKGVSLTGVRTLEETLMGNTTLVAGYSSGKGDTINGLGGNDSIVGSNSNDTIYYYADDTIQSNGGDDYIIAVDDAHTSGRLDAGAGTDTLEFTYQADVTFGGAGVATMSDIEYIKGSAYSDTLDATALTGAGGTLVTISGEAGNDVITAGAGNQTILGGDGNDYINGGGGTDSIDGGAGNDTIVFDHTVDARTTIDGGAYNDKLEAKLGKDGVLTFKDNLNATYAEGGAQLGDFRNMEAYAITQQNGALTIDATKRTLGMSDAGINAISVGGTGDTTWKLKANQVNTVSDTTGNDTIQLFGMTLSSLNAAGEITNVTCRLAGNTLTIAGGLGDARSLSFTTTDNFANDKLELYAATSSTTMLGGAAIDLQNIYEYMNNGSHASATITLEKSSGSFKVKP